MKTISFELAKRLNDAGLLKNINTDYFWYKCNETGNYEIVNRCDIVGDRLYICKAPILDEIIEILPKKIFKNQLTIYFYLKKWVIDYTSSEFYSNLLYRKKGKTLLEAIEKMLEYLLDNNLLGKQ